MSEVSKTVARKPEAKRENSVSQSQKANPSHSANPSVDRILFLQRTAGNHAVQKLIKSGRLQTNLRISQPGDIHEQEAEKVAQQVVSSTKLEGSHATTSDNKKNKSIQLSTQHSSDTAGASVPENFIPQPGHGQPINPSTKLMLESHIDADLSNVRVHSDPASHEAAKSLNARAFTYKNDIYLGSGESQNNVQLMAHEATHVVQQGAVIQRSPDDEASTSSSKGFWERAKEAVLEKVDKLVVNIPGFSLLCFILGRNPVTDKPVERNAINLFHGVLGLVPGGEALFENLQKSGAIEDAFAWLNAQIEKLNLTWEFIKGLFKQAWDALSITDIANPSKAFEKIQNIFGPTLGRIKNFAVAVGQKIFDFIFEGVLKLAGPLGTKVLGIIRKAGDLISKIVKDPIGFLGNLVQAIRKGFDQFSANILTHLKEGLMKWLFGALSGAGLRLPAKFDLMGILSIVLQVIGLTYAKLREKLVKILGEKPVAFIETAFEFLSLIVTKGLTAAWEKFLEFIGDLKEMVLGAIRDWVAGSIIKKAITKLVSMFNPVGAIIQAIMMTYDAITFFIERAKQIMELAEAVFDSIANIASGNLGAAANYVEKTMARTIPVIIGFLAGLIGLGGISEKIKKIIEGIQAKVDNALDKIVNFIVTKAKALFGMDQSKDERKDTKEGTAQKPFSLPKEGHTVSARLKDGNLEMSIASDRELEILAMLMDAKSDVSTNPTMDEKQRNEILSLLEGARNTVKSMKQDWIAASKQTMDFAPWAEIRLAQIVNILSQLGANGIEAFSKFKGKPLDKRYLPTGYDVRDKLYLRGGGKSNMESVRNKESEEVKKDVMAVIDNLTTNPTKAYDAWNRLVKGKRVPDGVRQAKDLTDEAREKTDYEVHHTEPLWEHWNSQGGNNTGDSDRWGKSDTTKLQYITKAAHKEIHEEDTPKKYERSVGKKFVSMYAEGGHPDAKKIDDLPLLDSEGGNPI